MSELSMDEALLPVNMIRLQADGSPNYLRQALHQIADNFDAIRTALAGGGGAEKVERPEIIDADRVGETRLYMLSLESRLAAAEKRAEEAEEYNAGLQLAIDEQRKNMAGFIAERDDLKEELAQARTELNSIEGYWDERLIKERERTSAAESERDAALARVKELEAKQSSSVHIDMAGIYVDGVKYTPEQVRSVVRRLAAIRDAAGAQP